MNYKEQGRRRGLKAAAGVETRAFMQNMEKNFEDARRLYPTAADMDFAAEIRRFDAERLASQPDLARFPELKGHINLLTAERKSFREATGLDASAVAFHYSWLFFLSRRMTSRHLARYELPPSDLIPAPQCTNVFFPNGAEGITISDNRDDWMHETYAKSIPTHPPPESLLKQDPVHWCQGGASAAVLLDDEPACLFPAAPQEYDLIPDECFDRIEDLMDFMTRYGDFWGTGNHIWVDRHLNATAVEKTNCLIAFRRPTVNGAIAITACAYLDERLHAHQIERDHRAMKIKGETEANCPDLHYHLGSRKRYQRLVDLANREAARPGGATLWGALDIVADHAVPYPARVCLAGERTLKLPYGNWSLTQHAAVISGPKRRCLYRSIQDPWHPRPVYDYTPKLMLGPGVKMQPEWQADVNAGRCELAPPVK